MIRIRRMNNILDLLRARPAEVIMADKLSASYENRHGAPNLDLIIHDSNIMLKEMPDPGFDKALSQFLEHGPDGQHTIYINTRYPTEHQHIGVAIALGHYFLRHGDCPRDTYDRINSNHPHSVAAKKFSQALLLPESAMQECVRQGKKPEQIARLFEVPPALVMQRLKSLHITR